MDARPDSTGSKERTFDRDDIIVSKTDTKGIITYANDVFLRIADYKEHEVLGKPHSLIRHPDMPRCIFKLLWDTIASGEEIFAYVVNQTKYGDFYWVLAHVTPSFDLDDNIVGYHSNRRVPNRAAIEVIKPLYRHLKSVEDSHANRKEGLMEAYNILMSLIREQDMRYDLFIYKLQSMQLGSYEQEQMAGMINV